MYIVPSLTGSSAGYQEYLAISHARNERMYTTLWSVPYVRSLHVSRRAPGGAFPTPQQGSPARRRWLQRTCRRLSKAASQASSRALCPKRTTGGTCLRHLAFSRHFAARLVSPAWPPTSAGLAFSRLLQTLFRYKRWPASLALLKFFSLLHTTASCHPLHLPPSSPATRLHYTHLRVQSSALRYGISLLRAALPVFTTLKRFFRHGASWV